MSHIEAAENIYEQAPFGSSVFVGGFSLFINGFYEMIGHWTR